MKVLIARSGVLEGNSYSLAGRTLIGRDGECDVQVMDPAASRKHASVLLQEDGSVLLRDLKSHNGTTVGGERIREVVLSPGDEVVVGMTRFEFQVIDAGKRRTQELELRLVSGPAQEPTLVGPIPSPVALTEFPGASDEAEASAADMPTQTHALSSFLCCENPLATRARAEGWKHCPACGTVIRY